MPPLWAKALRADVRLAGDEVHVGGLVDVAADFRQVLERAGPQAVELVLELEVGDERDAGPCCRSARRRR